MQDIEDKVNIARMVNDKVNRLMSLSGKCMADTVTAAIDMLKYDSMSAAKDLEYFKNIVVDDDTGKTIYEEMKEVGLDVSGIDSSIAILKVQREIGETMLEMIEKFVPAIAIANSESASTLTQLISESRSMLAQNDASYEEKVKRMEMTPNEDISTMRH